jgi:histidinol-phosphate phosphatase family protein
VPKPLVTVGGLPVLDHILATLARGGVNRFILAAGHYGEQIRDRYARHDFDGCIVETTIEPIPLGTSGGLPHLRESLDENFIVAYGDVFLDLDIAGLLHNHRQHAPLATLLVRSSDHPWDSHLVDADAEGYVRDFIHRRENGVRYRNIANAGLYAVSRRLLDLVPVGRPSDFGADLFPAALAAGNNLRVHHLEPQAFIKDMGTPERLLEVESYIAERALAEKARAKPGKLNTVFLDRDGVLNKDIGPISHPDQLHLLAGASEAVNLLAQAGLRCVILTNQSVVARGLCTPVELELIHSRLRELLTSKSRRDPIEAIYTCLHHPETHHDEGLPYLRRACRCRKPEPGLIFQACKELGLDLARCVLVGDRASDIQAAHSAGVRAILVGLPESRAKARAICPPDAEFDSLLSFAHSFTKDRPSVV